ncbi:TIM barrel protein [Candidatus Woesearchaeota archaeon]|nr:TIM barrel protein [Candidatus Woesearchaeota archaeon]
MILIGPGGSEGLGAEKGITNTKEHGLNLMEVEFTHGVNMNNEKAKIIGDIAKKNNFLLTIHAPYFINLASEEKIKVEASKKRILDSVERGYHMSAKYVVFHPGFYQGRDKEVVYQKIKEEIIELIKIIKENGWDKVELAPEITGKHSAFGDLDELLRLKKETGCQITIDFSHLYARNLGKIDYAQVIKKLPKKFHAHFSGITFTEKGERMHIDTTPEFFKPLRDELKKIEDTHQITIINESPQPLRDAVMMREELNK